MFLLYILSYFVLPALIICYAFLRKKFSSFSDHNIPHIAPTSLLGNLGGVGKKYHLVDFYMKLYNECCGKDVACGFYTMFVPTIVVTDLEAIKHITVKDFNNFTDRGIPVNEEVESITGNMFAIGGEKWRFLRSKLSPAFTSGKMKTMYHTISDKGDNFVNAIEKASKNGSVDTKSIASRYTVDVISSCAFGIEANTLANENPEMVNILKEVIGDEGASSLNQIRFLFITVFPSLSKLLKLRLFSRKVTEFFENIVGESMKYREDNDVTRSDFLNMLIQLKNKGSIDGETSTSMRKLTLNQCVAQAFVFFFGGADTSSTTISYALLELASNPEIQDKLRREILEKTESTNGEITYDNLHEISYLTQVINGKFSRFLNHLRISNNIYIILQKLFACFRPLHSISVSPSLIIKFQTQTLSSRREHKFKFRVSQSTTMRNIGRNLSSLIPKDSRQKKALIVRTWRSCLLAMVLVTAWE